MRVHLCGVRGSRPAPGQAFVRYGGHTSCVAIGSGESAPRLVLDAGTGLVNLSGVLDGHPFDGSILASHLHWDHILGVPFFRGGEHDDARVDLWIPAGDGPAEQVLERMMSPPTFPITPSQLRGRWTFSGLEEGEHTIEGFTVLAREIPHKGGRTFGYRVSDGTRSVAYLSDHDPRAGSGGGAARALAADVDLLIHDAQYTAADLHTRAHYGHATLDDAIDLAEASSAKRLLLFHHDPERTDEALDKIAAALPDVGFRVTVAREGDAIDL